MYPFDLRRIISYMRLVHRTDVLTKLTKANTQVKLEIAVKLRLMICVSFIGSQSKILDIATQPHPQAMLPMLHCHIKKIPNTMHT